MNNVCKECKDPSKKTGSQSGLCNACWQKKKYQRFPVAECSFCKKNKKAKVLNPLTCNACYVKNNKEAYAKKLKGNLKYIKKISSLFSNGSKNASKRGLPWKITKEQFEKLRTRPCFYCGGSLPETGHGLDRILNDKKIGYTIENVVPCCGNCNMIRANKLSTSEMIVAMSAIKEHKRQSFEHLHFSNYHIDSRTIFLFGEINEELANNVFKAVEIMENINSFAPIQVIVMSEGGNWTDGLGIYDRLKLSPCPIHMLGRGMVASTATAIFQAGDIREISSHCVFVLHDGTEGFEGEAKSFESWAEFSKKSRQNLYQIYAEKSKKPVSFWQTLCLKDSILTASQVVDYGLADRVQDPIKKLHKNEGNSEE